MKFNDLALMSGNAGKLAEIQRGLDGLGINLRSITEFTQETPEENAPTFVENALTKARFGAEKSGLPSLADDSGILVPALNGQAQPGVHSARYANLDSGEPGNADPAANRTKLLKEMRDLTGDERRAYFICVLALVREPNDPLPIIATGEWHGTIAEAEKGDGGFGYDPIFYLPEADKTAAELSPAEKNDLSHRGKALAELTKKIKEQ